MIDRKKLDQARRWANTIKGEHTKFSERAEAAAEIIQSLPDTIVDGEKLRKLIEDWESTTNESMTPVNIVYWVAAEALKSLLPAPTPPTLADMTPGERQKCQWMQCKVQGIANPSALLNVWDYGCYVVTRHGTVLQEALADVTPLPDLPKLEWPGQEARTKPHPEDVPEGECAMEEQMSEVERGYIVHDDVERTNLPERTHVRRFVTAWEKA